MNPSCVDVSEAKLPAPDASSSYSHWGGYPATLAALDGFTDLRGTDLSIAAMFDKLDMLDRASQDGVVDAMIQCGFKPSDVSKINSSLLDGICQAFGGIQPPDQASESMSHCIVRFMIPRPYRDALQWFLAKRRHPEWVCGGLNSPEMLLAAGLGLTDIVKLLLSYCKFADVSVSQSSGANLAALERAVINGREGVLDVMLSSLPSPLRGPISSLPLLREAARFGRLDVVKYLLQPSRNDFVNLNAIGEVLNVAVQTKHGCIVDLLLECCSDQLSSDALQHAFNSALGSGSIEMVERITAYARSRGLQLIARLAAIVPLLAPGNVDRLRLMLPLCAPDPAFVHEMPAPEYCGVEALTLLLETHAIDLRSVIESRHLKGALLRRNASIARYLLELAGMTIWDDMIVWIGVLVARQNLSSRCYPLLQRTNLSELRDCKPRWTSIICKRSGENSAHHTQESNARYKLLHTVVLSQSRLRSPRAVSLTLSDSESAPPL